MGSANSPSACFRNLEVGVVCIILKVKYESVCRWACLLCRTVTSNQSSSTQSGVNSNCVQFCTVAESACVQSSGTPAFSTTAASRGTFNAPASFSNRVTHESAVLSLVPKFFCTSCRRRAHPRRAHTQRCSGSSASTLPTDSRRSVYAAMDICRSTF